MQELTLAECRVAARSIREAQYGRPVVDVVRPRGPIGVVRSRGPLSLLLWVAAREGLLIWRNPDSLVLLRPPADKARPSSGGRTALARRLVRGWEFWIFFIPAAVLLAASIPVGLFAVVPALLMVAVALAHVGVLMVCLVATALVRAVRGLFRPVPARLPGEHWTMVLCHHVESTTPSRLLLRRVRPGLDELVGQDLLASGHGVRTDGLRVTEELVCEPAGITTKGMRADVEAWAERAGAGVLVRRADHRPSREQIRIFDRGGFLFLYLGGVAIVVLVVASFVPGWERSVCAPECAGHPVTYGLALRWLAQRLLLTDPFGLGPAAGTTWVIGWLTSLMSATGGLIVVTALRQYTRAQDIAKSKAREGLRMLNERSRTLVMVATSAERDAVLAATRTLNGHEPETMFMRNHVVLKLGVVSRTELMLALVEPGTVGPGSAALAAVTLIDQLEPDFLILVGICYGLRPAKHQFGDVLVGDQVRAIGHVKQTDPPGASEEPIRSAADAAARIEAAPAPAGPRRKIIRGDYVTPSTTLLSRFHEADRTWPRPPAIHFGPVLSASTLVNSRSLRDELADGHPDAIGGEMEAAGVYAAAAEAKVDWIVVKSICDWGFGKSDDFHEEAARNAATFVLHAAREGALDDAPARERR